uniref:DNA damage-regulated autophagy modulator protein 2 n=1 Tax=Panagrolaimus sp. ES5 TaxID=591445 RepID=A0AC34FCT9_9BILA
MINKTNITNNSRYTIAVSLNHVTAIWPYISDSGTLPPESCIFGQLLNVAALFLAATVYLRHRQIVEFYWHHHQQPGKWRSISCGLLFLGYTSAFGVSMVANFQESNVIYVHYTGALLAFGCGLIYAWAQTVFSYLMNPKLAKPVVSHCRLVLCIISSMFFCSMIIFGPILGKQPNSFTAGSHGGLYHWTGNEDNFAEHVFGTCSEWVLAICFQLYILSFAIELRHAYCHAPKLRLVAYYCDGSPSESALSIQSNISEKSVTCCTGFKTKKPKTYPMMQQKPPVFKLDMGNDEYNMKSLFDEPDRRDSSDGIMPVGLDTADFVNPARRSAFDESLRSMKF